MSDRLDQAINALIKQEGYGYTAGFLASSLKIVIDQLPKTKRKQAIADIERAVGQKVLVPVRNAMTGEIVEIPWDRVGSATDPSMESYWSA